ncbi:hypothetical protein [Actinomadura sp. 9N215]|uniref:hypothetical protein n=1 Tax=Actinomadura sp. 9N215 TaxID=3375150 RepID=UPI00378B268E
MAQERERNASDDGQESPTGRPVTPEKRPRPSEGPDVYLDVPLLKVDEISLEVENLDAHVSLVAQVLDLLRLNVGADVFLGKVKLDIKGVEAQAHLEVRLDNVAVIVDRVLTTLDRNPEILQHIGRGVESAAREIGSGTGTAVGEVGRGAKGAVQDVGRGAGVAVESVGEGTGGAVQDVGKGAGSAVQDVGKGAGSAVEDVGEGAGGAVQDVGKGTGRAAENVAEDVGEGAGEAARGAGTAAGEADDDQDITAVQTALHGTEESVRDLGRALLRMISQHPRSSEKEPNDNES